MFASVSDWRQKAREGGGENIMEGPQNHKINITPKIGCKYSSIHWIKNANVYRDMIGSGQVVRS